MVLNFLKKTRKKKLIETEDLAKKTGIARSSISAIENDLEYLGEERSSKIATVLSIPEDVMTVYRGHIPKYAHKVYREKPDKLEKKIRSAVKKLEKEDE